MTLLQYAAKCMSTKGKHDRLSWGTTAEDEPPSPLEVRERREDYKHAAGTPIPYHGS
jgi:hypothetical protein